MMSQNDSNYALACKDDTLAACIVLFHPNLAGISDRNDVFCFFVRATNVIMMGLTHSWKLMKFLLSMVVLCFLKNIEFSACC